MADGDRCVHGRCRIDPCIGCGRRYENGKLVGSFQVSMKVWLRAIDKDEADRG